MKKIVAVLLAGALMGAFAASYAKLPSAPPKSEEQKKAEAEKAAAAKTKDAANLAKAQDKAVANYKRHAAAMGKGNGKK
jgi:gas vesicle protein